MAASYTFEDLSGTATSKSGNPYDGLIEACSNKVPNIQARYETHRDAREAQQKAKLLSPEFDAVTIDETLLKLETQPGFIDPRHCLVFWARPPQPVRELISEVQRRLQSVAPKLWLMPQSCLHMTALEITHSLTEEEISQLVAQLEGVAQKVVDYPYHHRARLVKPKITYDAQAMALSFLPASGESLSGDRTAADDAFTYHHLRRELFAICTEAGVKVASRYVVPSAHLTIGRFIHEDEFKTDKGTFDHGRMERLVGIIDKTNEWLKEKYWPSAGAGVEPGGEWIIGQERGLDHRRGTLWYGGGETIVLGKGF
ncbi:ATP-dependent RNA helicase ded1 [Sphaceloma murrayae]|uniref:ATP-dependent RNA helicase ded1 n=1 Tax=Sphaceloma murrayae TaxID=2082308 RepID=A0A2K1QZU5_9PEZI|nr:ATP-dependent RNA helicase ded1 [Sphaceloma murrayae]